MTHLFFNFAGNNTDDKATSKTYLLFQRNIETHDKIINNELVAVKDVLNTNAEKLRHDFFIKSYSGWEQRTSRNMRPYGPSQSEMFLQQLIRSRTYVESVNRS